MNLERLNKLADFLDTIPEDRFDMNRWATVDFEEDKCGTAACAAGWATVLFKGEGLELAPPISYTHKGQLGIRYGKYTGFQAVEQFFNLKDIEADYLFLDYSNELTPKDVAEKIRQFIVDGGAMPCYDGVDEDDA